ncbi:uncharacterized protein LOC132400075 [Hypanus sabinus]|uniref:uncharacterized protein LOC132400075 n=1 Tax=Hypanus sabinus TaxID=79690 RepID=UPI0028C45A34|nr:uncharacterized protein LOC132400075 [Hypanus sabinus]
MTQGDKKRESSAEKQDFLSSDFWIAACATRQLPNQLTMRILDKDLLNSTRDNLVQYAQGAGWMYRPRPGSRHQAVSTASERLHRPATEISPTPESRAQSCRLPTRVQMLMEALTLFVTIQMFRVCEPKPFSESPAVVTAHVGQPVELSCELTYPVEVASNVLWYQQRADEPPVEIKSTDCRKTGCRTTYKKVSGDRTSVLEIRDVGVEDSGSYYCSRRDLLLAKGPTLLVGDSSTNRTYILVFVPLSERNGSVPLVCLVGGLSSIHIVIYWNISGEIMEGWSDTGTLDPDLSYSVRSQMPVPVETWRSGGVCTCIAQLGGAGKMIIKSVSHITIEPDQGTHRQLATHQVHDTVAQVRMVM